MRKIMCLFIIFAMLLTGCTTFSSFDYEYEYFNNHIGNLIERNDNGVYVLKNIEDVNSFKTNDFNNNFVQSLNKYEEVFFNKEYLIVIVIYNKPGNTEYNLISSNSENEILTIEIKEKVNSVSDDSLINKAFIIEVDNQEQYIEIKTKISK